MMMIVRGYVRDAGGGVVTIVVDRETEEYPGIGADVVLVAEDGPSMGKPSDG
jgi:hypothetical protein